MSIFLWVLVILFTYFFTIFIVAQVIKNNSIVDTGWGFGFVLTAVSSFLISGVFDLISILVTFFVTIWGLRLFYYILKRNLGKPEDFRYVKMRKNWGDKNLGLKAFIRVFMLQMIIMYIVSLPIMVSNVYKGDSILWIAILGAVVWLIGFYFEVIGDRQLKIFKRNLKNKGKIMQTGLWKYTRHPNYFGESAMWTGIFIMSIPKGLFYFTFISPLTITLLLIFVSGVPLLEKRYIGNSEYDLYKKRTNRFFPWFPKKEREVNNNG